MSLIRHFRPISTFLWKNHHLFCQGIQKTNTKFHLLPITWNLSKTLVTSKVNFKSDDDKSNQIVNQSENNKLHLEAFR